MNPGTWPAERNVQIRTGAVTLPAILRLPEQASGMALFAHGSGSGRLSPRNNAVAHSLQQAGLATLLADLLTEPEAQDRRQVFDISLLAERLLTCTQWVLTQAVTKHLSIGYFGASTGGGAALVAAAQMGTHVGAIVSRGGRPDLAGDVLPEVRSPTLLIVGGLDAPVLDLNEQALLRLRCEKQLVVVPGATHLFEEPGKLEEVARLAGAWFLSHLAPPAVAASLADGPG